MVVSPDTTELTPPPQELVDVLIRYIRQQGQRIDPNGIKCRLHANQLRASIAKRCPSIDAKLAKVVKVSSGLDDLIHIGGGIYNHHYFVIAIKDDHVYALDPYIPNSQPLPIESYPHTAFRNPDVCKLVVCDDN